MSQLEDINTIEEVAEYLRLQPRKVADMARQKRIGSVKEGLVVTITREDVLEYLSSNRRAPLPANPFGLTDASLRRVRTVSSKK
jgi:excisionase family DNA binding protein